MSDPGRRKDEAFASLSSHIPYAQFLGVTFERKGDEITGRMAYSDHLIGNPMLPALHGGATGAFLELTAIMELGWVRALEAIDADAPTLPPYPRPIDINIDYLRSGKPRDMYARAIIQRRGRRVANVRVEAWQEERSRLVATAHGHFKLPELPG